MQIAQTLQQTLARFILLAGKADPPGARSIEIAEEAYRLGYAKYSAPTVKEFNGRGSSLESEL